MHGTLPACTHVHGLVMFSQPCTLFGHSVWTAVQWCIMARLANWRWASLSCLWRSLREIRSTFAPLWVSRSTAADRTPLKYDYEVSVNMISSNFACFSTSLSLSLSLCLCVLATNTEDETQITTSGEVVCCLLSLGQSAVGSQLLLVQL